MSRFLARLGAVLLLALLLVPTARAQTASDNLQDPFSSERPAATASPTADSAALAPTGARATDSLAPAQQSGPTFVIINPDPGKRPRVIHYLSLALLILLGAGGTALAYRAMVRNRLERLGHPSVLRAQLWAGLTGWAVLSLLFVFGLYLGFFGAGAMLIAGGLGVIVVAALLLMSRKNAAA